MTLFGYYALHSFKNQLRKLLKTWVLIFFLVCLLIGGAIGAGVAFLEDAADGQTNTAEMADQTEIEARSEEDSWEEGEPGFDERMGIAPLDLFELIVGVLILAVFTYEALSADRNGGKIFLPADVNLLFASPMPPQSVLMFRLATQLGTALVMSVYLAFQLPNLILNFGLSIWAALAIIAVWCLTIAIGKLIQVLLYLISSNHSNVQSNLHRIVYAFLALIVVGYILFWKTSGDAPLAAAVRFLNGPATRLIPAWGWLKGACMFAMEGKLSDTLLCFAGVFALGAGLLFAIRRTKADFYEDAMAKSEETAALLEQAQNEKSAGLAIGRKRKKDRDETLRRDGMTHGAGANVFFYKSLYNRFRFAHLGFLTKTTETYLVLGAGVALICRLVAQTDSFIPTGLTLAGLAFFRSLGNPLEQDTKLDYFTLIPEPMTAKLFWSLLGGVANCFLDSLPGLLIGAIILRAGLLPALAWVPFILSVDFYATTVGTFIGVSVPVSAGKTVKQLVQVMFIYFGLLPVAAVMAAGVVYGHTAAAAVGGAVLNTALGLLFFALTARYLEPKGGKPVMPEETVTVDLKTAKKRFSRLGLAAFVTLVAAIALQFLLAALLNALWPEWREHGWTTWLLISIPVDLIAIPLGILTARKTPAAPPEQHTPGVGNCVRAVLISIFMMYAGNLAGTLMLTMLNALLGTANVNPVANLVLSDDYPVLRVLSVVVIAPVFEELLFRKTLIDRMRGYGEKLAVVTSALMFGLFHGNLSQFFYAAALGLVFGYVYLKTGKLRYTVALHVFINFLGSVLGPAILAGVDLSALDHFDMTDPGAMQALLTPGFLGYMAYAAALLGLAVAGLVVLSANSDRITFERAEQELPRGSRFRTVWLNAGMLLLVAGCLAMIIYSLL